MAFYYIKSGGTATGDAGRTTTARTGTFTSMGASAYYDSLKDIFQDKTTTGNTSVATGDSVRCSDVHSKTHASAADLGLDNVASSQFFEVISVDDTECETYKRGAHEETTTGNLTVFSSEIKKPFATFEGMSFKSTDADLVILTYEEIVYFRECTIYADDNIHAGKGGEVFFDDCDITVTNGFSMSIGSLPVRCKGGTVTIINYLVVNKGVFIFESVDFSGSTSGASLIYISGATGSSHLELISCKMPPSFTYSTGTTYPHGWYIKLTSCQSGNPNSIAEWQGDSISESTNAVYRSGGAEDRESAGVSIEIVKSDNNLKNFRKYFRVLLGSYHTDLTSVNTFTFHMMLQNAGGAPTALTDRECWVELHQNDATDTELGVVKNSNDTLKPTDTAANNTTSTETWAGVGAESSSNQTKQQMAVTTSTVSGLTNGNVKAYFCLAIDITSGSDELFICPSPVIT